MFCGCDTAMFRAQGLSCFAAAFSPFGDDSIAVACSQHYGIVGNGRLFVLAPSGAPDGAPVPLRPAAVFDTQDGLYDVAWSEQHAGHLVTAGADGVLRLWDAASAPAGVPGARPLRAYAEHRAEVSAVHWNCVDKDVFASASWDGTVRVWAPAAPGSPCVAVVPVPPAVPGGNAQLHSVAWAPYATSVLAVGASDGSCRIVDTKAPAAGGCLRAARPGEEVLSVDWNKYNENVVAAATSVGSVQLWDVRNPQGPLSVAEGSHRFAVKRVKWSPFQESVYATASYDLTVKIWDASPVLAPRQPLLPGAQGALPAALETIGQHKEFVCGLDWSLNVENRLASCGWDEMLYVFTPRSLALLR